MAHIWLLYRHTPSAQFGFYRVTQLRTGGVHCRESTGTGPAVLKVVPVTGAALQVSPWANQCAPLFPHIHSCYEVGMLKISRHVGNGIISGMNPPYTKAKVNAHGEPDSTQLPGMLYEFGIEFIYF